MCLIDPQVKWDHWHFRLTAGEVTALNRCRLSRRNWWHWQMNVCMTKTLSFFPNCNFHVRRSNISCRKKSSKWNTFNSCGYFVGFLSDPGCLIKRPLQWVSTQAKVQGRGGSADLGCDHLLFHSLWRLFRLQVLQTSLQILNSDPWPRQVIFPLRTAAHYFLFRIIPGKGCDVVQIPTLSPAKLAPTTSYKIPLISFP